MLLGPKWEMCHLQGNSNVLPHWNLPKVSQLFDHSALLYELRRRSFTCKWVRVIKRFFKVIIRLFIDVRLTDYISYHNALFIKSF